MATGSKKRGTFRRDAAPFGASPGALVVEGGMPIDPEIIPAGKFIPIGIILSNAIFGGREGEPA
jgi:hypothetical protein